MKQKIKTKTKKQRRAFFESLENIPGYICRTCWSAVAWELGSKEPKCKCTNTGCVPIDVVVPLPNDWWQAEVRP